MAYAHTQRLPKRGARCPRVPAALAITSRTIGTEAVYDLSTVDISKSGILVSWDRRGHLPFIVNTILEITIDPDQSWLDAPVHCLAKVVRRVTVTEDRLQSSGQLGIQILQMDQGDMNAWETCLTALEKRFGHLVGLAA